MENFALGRGATPDEIEDMTQDSKKRKPTKLSVWCCYGLLAVVLVAGGLWGRSAFLKVRNNSIEKAMLGEARQISSAARQYMAEHDRKRVWFHEIAPYLGGGRMSSGMQVSSDAKIFYKGQYQDAEGDLNQGRFFYIRHPMWSKTLSLNPRLTEAAWDEHTLRFLVDTGAVDIR